MPGSRLSPQSPSYRWVIVVVAAFSLLNVYGIRHSFSAFFPPILAEFGWSRGATALMFSLNILLYGFFAPIAGSLADRWHPKRLILLGILTITLSAIGCASAKELWHFYVLYGVLMSLGAACAGVPVLIPAVANWFAEKRGLAIGLTYAGGGSSFAMPIYAGILIASIGWRWTFLVMAGSMAAIVVPIIMLFFRYRPDKTVFEKLHTATTTENRSPFGHLELSHILRNYRLWLLVLAQTTYMGFANYMVVAHQVIYFEDLGYTDVFAASIAGFAGIFIALGALSGFLADRFGREKSLTLAAMLSTISVVTLLLQRDASHPWALCVYATSFGLGMGLMGPSLTAGVADLFHGRHFGTINGLMLFGMGFGGVIGPWLGGYLFDISGSYTVPFVICLVAYAFAIVSIWTAAPRKAKQLATRNSLS
jgi:MFS family permease